MVGATRTSNLGNFVRGLPSDLNFPKFLKCDNIFNKYKTYMLSFFNFFIFIHCSIIKLVYNVYFNLKIIYKTVIKYL